MQIPIARERRGRGRQAPSAPGYCRALDPRGDHVSSVWELLEKVPEVAPATRIARQGIYDRDGRLVAGELLFRGHHADHSGLPSTWDAVHDDSLAAIAAEAAADQATSHVIVTTFGDFGVERLGGGKPLFINVTRSFLAGDYPLPFGPEGVVLEILENVRVDQEVLDGVARAARARLPVRARRLRRRGAPRAARRPRRRRQGRRARPGRRHRRGGRRGPGAPARRAAAGRAGRVGRGAARVPRRRATSCSRASTCRTPT